MCNQVRVQICLPLAFHAHVVVASQPLLAPNLLITNPPPSTSLTFELELVHLPMLSRPFQMLTFVHMTGLKITQLQCLHWNIIIQSQQVAMTSLTTSGTFGDRLTPNQMWW